LRRFDEALNKGSEIIATREGEIKAGGVPVEIKEQVVFEIQKLQEDVKKRLKGPKTQRSVRRAQKLLGKTRRILRFVKSGERGFVDLQKELKFDPKLRALYEAGSRTSAVIQEENGFEGNDEEGGDDGDDDGCEEAISHGILPRLRGTSRSR